jgi:phospholipid/cholesterol/gamma-HCH transport system substrate-binding protein
MDSKKEQALVGVFVLIVAALLIVVVFLKSGTLDKENTPYHTYFKNAGGLEPGAEVRYLNGPPIGRVGKVEFDPQDPTRMKIDFSAKPDIPVKTDSVVAITSTSPLGENFLEILAGTPQAPRAPHDAFLKAKEPTSFSDIADRISEMTPAANELIKNLNDRVVEVKVTLARVNDLLNDKNRENISASLGDVRGMLHEDRPLVHSTLTNVNDAAAKLQPLIENFQKTVTKVDGTLDKVDGMISDNRADIRQSIIDLRQALANANTMVASLNTTVVSNSENLDEIIDNLRHVTENLNSFTETIKTRPYTLLRDSEPKSHKPGSALPQ